MSFKIRTFRYEDLDQVREIEKTSFPDPYSSLVFSLLELKVGEGFIVAEEDRIVGYAISEILWNRGHIISMAVSPESRRIGVGSALLQELIRRVKPRVHEAYLEVSARNEAAIRLYEKFSFEKTGETIERYYPGGEDAIIMARSI